MKNPDAYYVKDIHRHIGGLEKHKSTQGKPNIIHRHIGGLEICNLL